MGKMLQYELNRKNQATGSHRSHTLGQKQPKETGHIQLVSVEKRTRGMKGKKRKKRGRRGVHLESAHPLQEG